MVRYFRPDMAGSTRWVLAILVASPWASSLLAATEDKITIYNKSEFDIFARIYYFKGTSEPVESKYPPIKDDEKPVWLPVIAIPAGQSATYVRPPIWRYQTLPYPKHYDRQLVFSRDTNQLVDKLESAAYQALPSVNVGSTKGTTFYITWRAGHLEGYNAASWVTVKPLIDAKAKASDLVRARKRTVIVGNKQFQREKEVAQVRQATGGGLCLEEITYIEKKDRATRAALEKMGIKVGKKIPTIAFVASGGGYRAMLGTIGSLAAAQDMGLFQAANYAVGLSGSTWAIGGYMSHKMSPLGYKNKLIPVIEKGLTSINADEASLIGEALLLKYAFDQKLTIVDVYGALLATRLLGEYGNKRHIVYLSDQIEMLTSGKFAYQLPLPLYSAVRRGQGVPTSWWEFTPYEVGSAEYGKFVPSWAYGRKFYRGKSVGKPPYEPEQSFGFLMGTFGSAFAAEFKIMYNEIIKGVEEPEKTVIKEIMKFIDTQLTDEYLTRVGKKRIRSSWAQVHNFMLGMDDSGDLQNAKEIKLVDGGIDFNLPYPLVSGFNSMRKADIVILLDYSGDIKDPAALKGCESYAQEHSLPFPRIEYANLTSRAITVFKDETDPATPIIVYMPLVRDQALWKKYIAPTNKTSQLEVAYFKRYLSAFDPIECEQKGFCKTQSFKYAADQSQRLIAQAEFNMLQSIPVIKQVIQEWVASHQN